MADRDVKEATETNETDHEELPEDDHEELPESVVEEAETLTRRARRASDDAEAAAYRERRDELLAEHEFTARIREDDGDEVLVCHPVEWVVDGTIRTERIEEIDRAVEVHLDGAGDPDEWEKVAEHNETIARQVRERHGEVHGENAAAFAEYMNNHCAKPVEKASPREVELFLEEYFVRNVWASEAQEAVVEESVESTLAVARE